MKDNSKRAEFGLSTKFDVALQHVYVGELERTYLASVSPVCRGRVRGVAGWADQPRCPVQPRAAAPGASRLGCRATRTGSRAADFSGTIGSLLDQFSASECAHYVRHCGYSQSG